MITLIPPRDAAPVDNFVLNTGTLCRPNFAKGGIVTVSDDGDIAELLRKGWQLDVDAKKAERFESEMLRRAADSAERHQHGAEARTRVEFGEVDAGRHGRFTVSHDRSDDSISLGAVNTELVNLGDLRGAFESASAGFLAAAQDAASQRAAIAIIGALTAAALDRDPALADAVRRQRARQRYGA